MENKSFRSWPDDPAVTPEDLAAQQRYVAFGNRVLNAFWCVFYPPVLRRMFAPLASRLPGWALVLAVFLRSLAVIAIVGIVAAYCAKSS